MLIDDEVNQIIEYTLAYCLQKYDIKLHAIIIEGNHIHRVDTDKDGIRPKFNQDFWCYLASLGKGTPDALRSVVVIALGGTLLVSLVVVFTGVWPMAWIDDLGVSWLGRSSLRWRITGAFVVFGSMFLAMLLGALLAKKAWKALSEQGGTH